MTERTYSEIGGGLTGLSVVTAAAWTPASLPNLVAWWDADDSATITQAAGLVSAWADKSGAGNDLTQGTALNQPITGSDTIGGKNAIKFGTTGSEVMVTASLSGIPSARTVLGVILYTDASGYPCFVGASGFFGWMTRVNAGTPVMELDGNASFGVGSSSTSLTVNVAAQVGITRTDGAGYAFYLNGAADGSGSSGSSWAGHTQVVWVGNTSSGGGGVFKGDIAELILCDSVLGTTDRQLGEAYLKAKWGTP